MHRWKAQLALALVSAFLLSGCEKAASSNPRWQGYVEADYVYVASPIGGQLAALKVSRGGVVKEGDALFSLDSRDEAAKLAAGASLLTQAQATLDDMRKGKRPEEIAALEEVSRQAKAVKDLADTEFLRASALIKSNAIPVKDYDSANYTRMESIARLAETTANLTIARLGSRDDQIRAWESYCSSLKSNVDALKWAFDQKSQAAPKGGRVFDTFYREGEYVAASMAVVALIPPENVRIRFFVGETQISSMKAGGRVSYKLDGSEAKGATICYISPQVEYTPPVIYSRESRAKLVFMVEARPDAADAPNLNIGVPLDVWNGAAETPK